MKVTVRSDYWTRRGTSFQGDNKAGYGPGNRPIIINNPHNMKIILNKRNLKTVKFQSNREKVAQTVKGGNQYKAAIRIVSGVNWHNDFYDKDSDAYRQLETQVKQMVSCIYV